MKAPLPIVVFAFGLLFLLDYPVVVQGQEPSTAFNAPITNLWQLDRLMNSNERLVRDVQLEATVCAASDSSIGVVILQDSTNTGFFHFGSGIPQLFPGDKVRIARKKCLLRRQEPGVHLTVQPVVDNNGIHARSTSGGGIGLKGGRHSILVEWFNRENDPSLEVKWHVPGA
ncbi:MAG TPA: hypothetical protein VK327_04420, partial [Candidatus Paceibacterota bacterium]|nr:hypothetical protein [Candidatus Paceibacterota bacterium]